MQKTVFQNRRISARTSHKQEKFTNYNWASRSVAVCTARSFGLFDICICLFQSILISNIIVYQYMER